MNSIFFLCSPINIDSLDKKESYLRRVHDSSGINDYLAAGSQLDITIMSSVFDVMEVLDPLLLILVEDSFFNKVLVCL